MKQKILIRDSIFIIFYILFVTCLCFYAQKNEEALSEVKAENKTYQTQNVASIPESPVIDRNYAGFVKKNRKNIEQKQELCHALLYFTGDVMCLGGQQRAVKNKEYCFDSSFAYVKDILSGADFVCGNLESVISASNPYTEHKNSVNGNPNCNTRESFVLALKEAGFDAVVTANNHTYDWGAKGINDTVQVLNQHEILNAGTVKEQPFLLTEVNGISVAVLSYTEIINQRNAKNAAECSKVIQCYSRSSVEKDIETARKAGADLVVVYNHWGKENTTVLTKSQKEHAQEIAEAGADLIIGCHPHCLQEACVLTTSDNRQVLCMYSMGNFVSSMVREINKESVILAVDVTMDEKNQITLSYEYLPVYTMGSLGLDQFTVVPVTIQGVSKKVRNQLSNAEQNIKKTIKDAISSRNDS